MQQQLLSDATLGFPRSLRTERKQTYRQTERKHTYRQKENTHTGRKKTHRLKEKIVRKTEIKE